MGQAQVYVDSAALADIAQRFDVNAELLDGAARERLARLAFDGAAAGREHVAAGEALRRALDRWWPELARWSRAGTEIAAALRSGLAAYGAVDLSAADRVG